MEKKKNFCCTLVFLTCLLLSSCLKEEYIYHNQNEYPPETEVPTEVISSSLKDTLWQVNTSYVNMSQTLQLKVLNQETEEIKDENLILNLTISWNKPDTIIVNDIDTKFYMIADDPQSLITSKDYHNISIKTYQSGRNFGINKIKFDFKIIEEQAVYQTNNKKISAFIFDNIELKHQNKKLEYEYEKQGNLFQRYKFNFNFEINIKNTYTDEDFTKNLTCYAWLDLKK